MHFIIQCLTLAFIASTSATMLWANESAFPVDEATLNSWTLPEVSYPEFNPYKKAVEEVGKQLFFDPRLTGDRALSCAACHFPGTGWSDPIPNKTENTYSMERQAPTLINTTFQSAFFWDGRSDTLEHAIELHLKELLITSKDVPGLPESYQQKFQQAFDSPSISTESIAKALANFLRSIVVRDSPFDQWLSGDKSALSQSARQGFLLFTGKAKCSKCHTPPNFSDSAFHNIGLNTLDPGHQDVSGKTEDKNHFRTSSLRQISHTPPYMHTGTKQTLMSVIEFYNQGGDRHEKGNELDVLNLTEQEERELLDFLMSLTGSDTSVIIPQLPLANTP